MRATSAVLLIIASASCLAQSSPLVWEDYGNITPESASLDRDGFALVLGGGGARGLAHVGVLRVLEEEGLRPSLIVGTSMGAVLGSLYACGIGAERLEELVSDRAWLSLFFDERVPADRLQGGRTTLDHHQLILQLDRWPPSAPAGASYGQAVEDLVGRLSADALFRAASDFDQLPIPFRCVSTDVRAAAPYVSSRGALARAVRASGSLPLIFVPVEMDGRTLMDGGLVDNLPIEVARRLGFQRILAVDVSNIFLPYEGDPDDVGALIRRVTHLTQRAQNHVVPRDGEIVLRVDLLEHNALSFWSATDIVRSGYRDASQIRESLRELPRRRGEIAEQELGPVRIRRLSVFGNRRMSAWSIRRRLGVRPGDVMELEELWARASALAGLSIFHNAWLEIVRTDGTLDEADVRLHVIERDKAVLELGAHYLSQDGLAGLVRLRLDNLLRRGEGTALQFRASDHLLRGELRMAQAIRGTRHFEVQQDLSWAREWWRLYEGELRIDQAVHERLGGEARFHLRPSGAGATLQFGLLGQSVDSYRTEDRDASRAHHELRAFSFGVESGLPGGLSLVQPRGYRLRYVRSVDAFGGELRLWQLEGGATLRHPLSPSWIGDLRAGFAAGSDDRPLAFQSRAGGPQGWVGFRRDAVVAAQLLWLRPAVAYEFRPEFRVEFAGGLGWAGQRFSAARPNLGALMQLQFDSFAGPIRVGVQGRRHGESQAFVQVGYEF